MKIRAMQESDYEKVYALWCEIKGFGLRSIDDSFENISAFLGRNPGLSAVAELRWANSRLNSLRTRWTHGRLLPCMRA